jgi:FixJ family two-component response regulator
MLARVRWGSMELARVPMIAIIDDDESVREATRGLMRSLGYMAATFPSAEDFLRSSHVEDAACLITDVQMPGMSGVELQSYMLANGHTTPFIFVTAFAQEQVRARVLAAGAFGYLSKPCDEECLISCLDKALAEATGQPH